MKAIWNNKILAESDAAVIVENNHYFTPESLNDEYFAASDTHTSCPWKGVASYFNLELMEKRTVMPPGIIQKQVNWPKGSRGMLLFGKV